MATSTAKLESYLDFLATTFDFDRKAVQEAPNGDKYIEFSISTENRLEDRLEHKVLSTLNKAVDPDAYGIDTGPRGGQHTSTYTLIYDKSSKDFDLIGGKYDTYRNDLAGISDTDVPFARSGFATGIFLDGHAYRIAIPTAEVLGTSIKDWTENWWKWALQAPAKTNPLNDTSGDWSDVNNTAPVYFVAGALFLGGADVTFERGFTVESGRPLLIPVMNNLVLEPEDPNISDSMAMADANANLDLWEASVSKSDLSAVIDGVPVQNLAAYLVRTDFFSPGTQQPGSLLADLLKDFDIPLEDDFYPSRGSGYWLAIEGLSPGDHTISFGGKSSIFGSLSVTDHILVG